MFAAALRKLPAGAKLSIKNGFKVWRALRAGDARRVSKILFPGQKTLKANLAL
jgi:hypothetical protein